MGLHHASSWKFSGLTGLLPHCLPTMPPKQPHQSTALLGHLLGGKNAKLLRMASQISQNLIISRPVFQHQCPSTISWVVTVRPLFPLKQLLCFLFAISQHVPFHSPRMLHLFLHLLPSYPLLDFQNMPPSSGSPPHSPHRNGKFLSMFLKQVLFFKRQLSYR